MTSADTDSIIQDLRAAVAGGGDWYRAVLQAVQRWPVGEEDVEGERYVYLLDGEALDLLRVCERLCLEVADLVPEEQVVALLANDRPPDALSREELRALIGHEKYRSYLTFIYGVMVEEMVIHAVVQESRKRRRTSGLTHYDAVLDDAYVYVYGSTRAELFEEFRHERGLPRRRSVTLTQMKEFTYWLFKLRLRCTDKSRVASDTKRALTLLHQYASGTKRRPS